MVFAKVASGMWQFSVVVKLKRDSDDLEMVVVSIYGPKYAKRSELWGELAEVTVTFQGSLVLMRGNFNVTVEVMDRPNNAGGQDPD